MINNGKVIYPMMIELNNKIISDVYYLQLPKKIKEKWIELEKAVTNKIIYNLPTISLNNLLINSLNGVVNMNVVSEKSDDSKWLICFKEIDMEILSSYFRIWVDEFYIKGSIVKDKKRKNGNDTRVNKLASELKELIHKDNFEVLKKENVILFEDGIAKDKNSFTLLPLLIIEFLIGNNIKIHGKEAKLLYSNKNEMITETKVFNNKGDYYSFVIRLTVQTLPPFNKAYLNIDLSVRRWICRNEDEEGKNYLGNDKYCYVRVSENIMQCIKSQYSSEEKCNIWDRVDERCFNNSKPSGTLPNFIDVLKRPSEYNIGKIGDVLIPFQEGLSNIETSVKNGVSFNDRDDIFSYIKQYLYKAYKINSDITAKRIKKEIIKRKCGFMESNKIENVDDEVAFKCEYFSEQLTKALDGEVANIEIYAEKYMQEDIEKQVKAYIGADSKHKVTICEYDDIFCELPIIGEDSKKGNLIGYEIRVEEIQEALLKVIKPTIALVAIHDAGYYKFKYARNCGNYDKNKAGINIDPKEAIRNGFALTGRLTQFITIENYKAQDKSIEKAKEKYKFKKIKSDSEHELDPINAKKIARPNKTIGINKAVNGAVLDAFRQLGVVYDCSAIRQMKGKKIVGISICNYKTTKYGYIKPFPIIVTYDIDSSQIKVYCELIDKIDIPYWKAMLGLAQISSNKNIIDLNKSISSTTISRRVNRTLEIDDKNTIIVVEANGLTRKFIKGITNSELSKCQKNEYNEITKLLIEDEKYLDLTLYKKNFSIIRLRVNDEVPDYIHEEINDTKYQNIYGLFIFDEVYYSIDKRPQADDKTYQKSESKAIKEGRFSHRNMVEIYPIYVTGNKENHNINKNNSIEITSLLRDTSIQFEAQMTILPLPLHLAKKMEEYL